MSYLQSQRLECTIESYYSTGKPKKIDCFNMDGFCAHCQHSIRTKLLLQFLSMSKSLNKPLGGGNAERNQKNRT